MELTGWIATAVFTASYFFKRAEHLRRAQMLAACLWIAYGVHTRAVPVVVANLLVVAAAVFAGRLTGARDAEGPVRS